MLTRKPSVNVLVWYQRLAGLCDATTGLLLCSAPAWTLRLIGIHANLDPTLTAFVGVFVLGVGIIYLVNAGTPRRECQWHRLHSVWSATGISRSLVAVFLAAKVARGSLEPAWLSVALTDGVLATWQWVGLANRWLEPRNVVRGGDPAEVGSRAASQLKPGQGRRS